jgi:LacI family transcriptional regulator
LDAQSSQFAPPLFLAGDFRLMPDTGAMVAERLAELTPATRPTAIIASSDLMAISIQRALHGAGWRIPQEISVVGIDDISFAAYVTPPLTTLRLPRQRMGQLAFDLLAQLIDDPDTVASTQTVTPRLIRRESAGPAP